MGKFVVDAMSVAPTLKGGGTRASRTLVAPRINGVEGVAVGLNITQPGGVGEVHRHEAESETMYVIQGQIKFCLEDEEYICGPDSVVHVGAGVPHGFQNVGEIESKFVWIYSPPLPEHR